MKKIKLYIVLLVGVTLLLTGCVYDNITGCLEQQEQPQLVRISARIIPNHASGVRAEVVPSKDTQAEDSPFEKEVLDAEAFEERIDHVMLYVYQQGKLMKTIFYHDSSISAGMPAAFEGLEVRTFGRSNGQLTFDLELPKGVYRFVLLANDLPALKEAKEGKIRMPEKAKTLSRTSLLSTLDLAKASKDYSADAPTLMPMAGQAMLNIPQGNADGSRKEVTPSISIERVLARVDFYLTTAKEGGSEFADPTVARYASDSRDQATRPTQGLFVDLVDKSLRANHYVVLPLSGEYTATGDGLSQNNRLYGELVAPFTSVTEYTQQASVAMVGSVDPEDKYKGEAHPSAGGSRLAKVFQQVPTVSYDSKQLKYSFYLMPFFIKGATEADMPYLLFGLNTTGKKIDAVNTPEKAMTYFKMPITTILSGETTEEVYRS